jgi:hypothetical protein
MDRRVEDYSHAEMGRNCMSLVYPASAFAPYIEFLQGNNVRIAARDYLGYPAR